MHALAPEICGDLSLIFHLDLAPAFSPAPELPVRATFVRSDNAQTRYRAGSADRKQIAVSIEIAALNFNPRVASPSFLFFSIVLALFFIPPRISAGYRPRSRLTKRDYDRVIEGMSLLECSCCVTGQCLADKSLHALLISQRGISSARHLRFSFSPEHSQHPHWTDKDALIGRRKLPRVANCVLVRATSSDSLSANHLAVPIL